jgi:hypothetical protein
MKKHDTISEYVTFGAPHIEYFVHFDQTHINISTFALKYFRNRVNDPFAYHSYRDPVKIAIIDADYFISGFHNKYNFNTQILYFYERNLTES